jgi:hypothetical protein
LVSPKNGQFYFKNQAMADMRIAYKIFNIKARKIDYQFGDIYVNGKKILNCFLESPGSVWGSSDGLL